VSAGVRLSSHSHGMPQTPRTRTPRRGRRGSRPPPRSNARGWCQVLR
jgi:hypothetical protein